MCSGRWDGCHEEGKYNSLQESHLQQGKWPFFLVRYTYLPHAILILLCESASQAVARRREEKTHKFPTHIITGIT